jgi:hypothetical protein
MPASRVFRLAIVGLSLTLFAPLLTVPALPGASQRLSDVPVAKADWMILETSGIQCTFKLNPTDAASGCRSNNVNVQVFTSAMQYSAVDGELSVDLAVQNVGTLTLATADGTTSDPAGARVFVASGPFQTDPFPTEGTGAVALANPDGSDGPLGKPYYQYSGALLGSDGILSPGEISGTKSWRLSVGTDAREIQFSLGVAAEVPSSGTPTPTDTPSPTPTETGTPTPSPTATETPSPIPTDTPTSTPTVPATLTYTPTSSSTPTQTTPPTSTPTQTLPRLATATSTSVGTPTSTPQPTRTPKPTRPSRAQAG